MPVHSGASDSVVNRNMVQRFKTYTFDGRMKGIKYVATASAVISHESKTHVEAETDEGHRCKLKMQHTAVNKALSSVSKTCTSGHGAMLTKPKKTIIHNETGQVVSFRRADGVYRLRLRVVGEHGAGLQRLGN